MEWDVIFYMIYVHQDPLNSQPGDGKPDLLRKSDAGRDILGEWQFF